MRRKATFNANKEKMQKELDDQIQLLYKQDYSNCGFGPSHAISYAAVPIYIKYLMPRIIRRKKHEPNYGRSKI